MKKRLTAAVIALCLIIAFIPAALADGEETTEVGIEAALAKAREKNEWIKSHTAQEIADAEGIYYWDVISPTGETSLPEPQLAVTEDMTWQDVIDMLFEKYGIDPDSERLTIGYYNTLTGEERYYLPDTYKVSASMFKVPLNMIYTDRISGGEMSFDDDIYGASYSWYQYRTLVRSDNNCSMTLINYLGGYSAFKELQIPYLGNNPVDDIGYLYSVDNYYTARQFINILRMLYYENERFPGIIENMLQAEPYNYFKEYEHDWPIAQKYGFVEQTEGETKHTYINSCAIAYTDTPFFMVLFTDNLNDAYNVMSEFSVLMCQYTNIQAEKTAREQEEKRIAEEEMQRLAEEAEKAAADAEAQAAASASEAASDVQSSEQTQPSRKLAKEPIVEKTVGSFPVEDFVILIAIFFAMIAAAVIIFRNNGAGRINGVCGIIAIICAGIALASCVIGMNMGTIISRPDGNPQETVIAFCDSITAGDYSKACEYLSDYSDLGLGSEPESEEGRMLFDALKNSYAYTVGSAPVINGLNAVQHMSFRFLNLESVAAAAGNRVPQLLEGIVQTRPASQVYDETGGYLKSVTDEVYHKALTEELSDPSKYYSSSEFDVELEYCDGKWMMSMNRDFLNALTGGAS